MKEQMERERKSEEIVLKLKAERQSMFVKQYSLRSRVILTLRYYNSFLFSDIIQLFIPDEGIGF